MNQHRDNMPLPAVDQYLYGAEPPRDECLGSVEERLDAYLERRIDDMITKRTPWLVLWQLGFVATMAALAFGLR